MVTRQHALCRRGRRGAAAAVSKEQWEKQGRKVFDWWKTTWFYAIILLALLCSMINVLEQGWCFRNVAVDFQLMNQSWLSRSLERKPMPCSGGVGISNWWVRHSFVRYKLPPFDFKKAIFFVFILNLAKNWWVREPISKNWWVRPNPSNPC